MESGEWWIGLLNLSVPAAAETEIQSRMGSPLCPLRFSSLFLLSVKSVDRAFFECSYERRRRRTEAHRRSNQPAIPALPKPSAARAAAWRMRPTAVAWIGLWT